MRDALGAIIAEVVRHRVPRESHAQQGKRRWMLVRRLGMVVSIVLQKDNDETWYN